MKFIRGHNSRLKPSAVSPPPPVSPVQIVSVIPNAEFGAPLNVLMNLGITYDSVSTNLPVMSNGRGVTIVGVEGATPTNDWFFTLSEPLIKGEPTTTITISGWLSDGDAYNFSTVDYPVDMLAVAYIPTPAAPGVDGAFPNCQASIAVPYAWAYPRFKIYSTGGGLSLLNATGDLGASTAILDLSLVAPGDYLVKALYVIDSVEGPESDGTALTNFNPGTLSINNADWSDQFKRGPVFNVYGEPFNFQYSAPSGFFRTVDCEVAAGSGTAVYSVVNSTPFEDGNLMFSDASPSSYQGARYRVILDNGEGTTITGLWCRADGSLSSGSIDSTGYTDISVTMKQDILPYNNGSSLVWNSDLSQSTLDLIYVWPEASPPPSNDNDYVGLIEVYRATALSTPLYTNSPVYVGSQSYHETVVGDVIGDDCILGIRTTRTIRQGGGSIDIQYGGDTNLGAFPASPPPPPPPPTQFVGISPVSATAIQLSFDGNVTYNTDVGDIGGNFRDIDSIDHFFQGQSITNISDNVWEIETNCDTSLMGDYQLLAVSIPGTAFSDINGAVPANTVTLP